MESLSSIQQYSTMMFMPNLTQKLMSGTATSKAIPTKKAAEGPVRSLASREIEASEEKTRKMLTNMNLARRLDGAEFSL